MPNCALRILALATTLVAAGGTGYAAIAAEPSASAVASEANDYANANFTQPLDAGIRHFYARDFQTAQGDFERALEVIPDNTFAISFLGAAAAQQPGALATLTDLEEDAVGGAPKNYVNHVRLGFTYMFASIAGRDRLQEARDEFTSALTLAPDRSAAHVGLGILRFNERSAHRAKTEFLEALKTDPNNVLAREYLAQLYQTDLHDPQRGLTYAIVVPNFVPQYADIHFHLGSLLHDLKQPEAALRELETALELDPGRVGEARHSFTLMARIYLEQHDLAEAKKALDRSLAANVDTIIARHLLEKIGHGDYDPPKARS
jgi:Tfp pilus assembly protein PilF